MNFTVCLFQSAQVAWFSGTGCTAMAAECFEQSFRMRGIEVTQAKIEAGQPHLTAQADLLVLLFPVYAFRSPRIVDEWVRALPMVSGTPAVVCSVSGGGDIPPNTACRVYVTKVLRKKGYQVIFEKMLVMPSNFVVSTPNSLAKKLIGMLPAKVDRIVADVISGQQHKPRVFWLDRFGAAMGRLEQSGAKIFGKHIKASDSCNGCGLCAGNCPTANIAMEHGKPMFHKNCIICLKCIYNCPTKALSAGVLSFIVLKEGFSLKQIAADTAAVNPGGSQKTGILLSGVEKYIFKPDL